MLHGRTVRSTIPRGRITSIRFGFDTSGFTIVGPTDIPGSNVIASIDSDQPCLAEAAVNHAAEPVLLLAHEDRDRLWAAPVEIAYEEAPANFDPARSPRIFKQTHIAKGDIARGFAEAAYVIEGEYRTGHQEHVYIEPQGMIAVPSENGVTIYGSMQCPFYVHRALCELLALSSHQVRVIQVETGGGFGGKEEYPSMIAGHAALLALKSRRPVKLVYDRTEDMLATTKRHPSIVRHRTGVTRDGLVTAIEVEVLLDGGAYCTLSPVVLSRAVLHACGAYRAEHVKVAGRVAMTNTPPNGAFRGFGAPQTIFAMEVQMERIAEVLGLDPVRIRELNLLRPGDTTATGQVMRRDCSALRVLREAVKRTDFRRRRRTLRGKGRGIGLALYLHGAGFTGAGEVRLASTAALDLTARGFTIRVASTEIGQGARTVLAQIVADALGVPIDSIEVARPDTSVVPDSGPTVASRTSMIVGKLLERCAVEMKARLGGMTPAAFVRSRGPLTITRSYEKPADVNWDDEHYRGEAYASYGWGCDVVEVELDPDTYEARPVAVTAVVDIGRVLNPALAEGQVIGGTAQGIGYALLEQVAMRDGRMANAQLTNYIIPTSMDLPDIDVVFVENRYSGGPFGAKGLGELPFDGAAPAVVNAIRHLGIDICALPATPERIQEAMEG